MTLYPIETIYTSGSTLYAVIHGIVAGVAKVWNTTLNAGSGDWQTFVGANWSQYAVAMTEQTGSGYYSGTYPTAIEGILTTEALYIQGGGSPALGDSPVATVKSQGSNLAAIAGETQSALNLGSSAGSQQTGSLIGTPTASVLPTDLTSTEDDAYLGRILIMTSGNADQQVQYVTAYDGTTKVLTLAAPLATAPAAADTFVIV